ncbi:hypothetical protein MtrunA17_Chr6g0475871 [Medicago truncatula]|uniref:Transmembrane protein n=1 Tax=Medicago truncatula TaxID=3880 RepID=A0A396HHG4_MEDTR|nr:hypothetical protein MtrunA17_Chr6g0475871 [Medicago truncatula]
MGKEIWQNKVEGNGRWMGNMTIIYVHKFKLCIYFIYLFIGCLSFKLWKEMED